MRVHARSLRLRLGGAIDLPDRIAWSVEAGTETLRPKLARSARAALRETWEEAGVLIGRTGGSPPPVSAALPIEHAYRDRGLVAAMDVLTYVSRAITPFRSFRRFTPGSFSATAAMYSASRWRAKNSRTSAGTRSGAKRSHHFAT